MCLGDGGTLRGCDFLLSPFAPRKNASLTHFCGTKDDDVLYLANKITAYQCDSDGRGNRGIDF